MQVSKQYLEPHMKQWEEPTHWKRPWYWERLKAGGDGDNRGWDGWMHHRLNGHEFELAPGVGDGQESLAFCIPWGCKESDMTNQTELKGGLIPRSCPTLVTPWIVAHQAPLFMDFPGRILEWVVISFSRASSQPRDWTWVSCIAGWFFTIWVIREAPGVGNLNFLSLSFFNLEMRLTTVPAS